MIPPHWFELQAAENIFNGNINGSSTHASCGIIRKIKVGSGHYNVCADCVTYTTGSHSYSGVWSYYSTTQHSRRCDYATCESITTASHTNVYCVGTANASSTVCYSTYYECTACGYRSGWTNYSHSFSGGYCEDCGYYGGGGSHTHSYSYTNDHDYHYGSLEWCVRVGYKCLCGSWMDYYDYRHLCWPHWGYCQECEREIGAEE